MNPRTTTARRDHTAAPRRPRAASPAIPRRVSGPVARPVRPRPAAAPARPPAATRRPAGLLQWVAALPDHRLVDRLMRGRMWIWLVGLSLGGLVTMEVSLLKLNTGISRAVQSSSTLELQNASLEAGIARLSSRERLAQTASTLGLTSPEAGDVVYVSVRPSVDARRAVGRMSEPSEQAIATVAAATGATTAVEAGAGTGDTGPVPAAAAPSPADGAPEADVPAASLRAAAVPGAADPQG